jgi:hypothetical protein
VTCEELHRLYLDIDLTIAMVVGAYIAVLHIRIERSNKLIAELSRIVADRTQRIHDIQNADDNGEDE